MSQTRNLGTKHLPTLGPIKHIAHYSFDGNGSTRYDLSNLSTFTHWQPRVGASLLRGRHKFFANNRNNRFLGHPMTINTLIGSCIAFKASGRIRAAHVVTWRGVVTKLMMGVLLPLKFSYLGNTLYLEEFDPTPRKRHAGQLLDGYHGYAFEALCTTPYSPKRVPTPDLDFWKCIVTRPFGDLNLVFGGEVDCVRGRYDNSSRNLVELKTKRKGKQVAHRDKWFFQSHLLGVPEIVVGSRADDGTLASTHTLVVEDMYPAAVGVRERGYRMAYQVLTHLRAFCAHANDTRGLIWRTEVCNDMVKQPVLLQDTRKEGGGGLVASKYVVRLTTPAPRGAVVR